MTVRQVYYQLVSRGAIAKTEAEYKSTVVRLLGLMRRENEIPYGWIADSTRWMRKPTTWSSAEEALEHTARFYRRALWDDQPIYCEVWLEKEALAGVLMPITRKYDVPLMVCRGYPSLSFLHAAAETIDAVGKPAHLYYLGDHDPSGIDIPRAVELGIREMAPAAEVHFERIAVTEQQIEQFRLPTRPTKKTDSRSKNFRGESVEVDAIPSSDLRELVQHHIERHIDQRKLELTKLAEEHERKCMRNLQASLEHELHRHEWGNAQDATE